MFLVKAALIPTSLAQTRRPKRLHYVIYIFVYISVYRGAELNYRNQNMELSDARRREESLFSSFFSLKSCTKNRDMQILDEEIKIIKKQEEERGAS